MFGKSVAASSAVDTSSVTDVRRKTRRLPSKTKGLKFKRVYTTPGVDPYDTIEWDRRSSKITNPDGSTVFKLDNVEVPEFWSQVAADVLAQKYFRKAGVPARLKDADHPRVSGRMEERARRARPVERPLLAALLDRHDREVDHALGGGEPHGVAGPEMNFGAVIEFDPWRDDFSAARNRSLDVAKGDWIPIRGAPSS